MRTIHRLGALLAAGGLLAVQLPTAPVAWAATSVTDADGAAVVIEDTSRVVTLGGVFTEIAYALGAQDRVVAVDDSSAYPPEALADKPAIGYYRFLSAEPVLAVDPSLVIGDQETGPPEVVAQLRDAGVPVVLLPDSRDVEGARAMIATLGEVLDAPAAADALVEQLDHDVAAAQALVAEANARPRVLFVLQPPEAPMLVAGGETAAGSMIELAGGENIYPGFDSYVPMTPEGVLSSAPDVILTTDDSLERKGGLDAFRSAPGIAQTPAAIDGRIVSMDLLYLLGFGPRTGRALADLAVLLHPELAS